MERYWWTHNLALPRVGGRKSDFLLATLSNLLPILVRDPAAFRYDMTFGKCFLKHTYAIPVLHRST